MTEDEGAEQRIDLDLIARTQQGDQEAFASLYNRYAPRVLGLTRRVIFDSRESEDIVQIVFWNVWQKCRAYQPERGTVQAYIFQIAKTRMIDAMRRNKHAANEFLSRGNFLEDQAQSDSGTDFIDASLAVSELLEPLSPQERLAVELSVYGGFTQREISQMLHRPLGSVKSWVRRGFQKVKKAVENADSGRKEGNQ